VLFFVFLLNLSAYSQQAPASAPATPDADKQLPARQSAMNMLEEVLAGTSTLALPQNRLAIELQAFPIIAARSQSRARGLINQMVAEFSQAASQSDQNRELSIPRLRQERTLMTNALAQTDAEMALQFLTATLPYVESTSPKDEGPDDSDLLLALAAQIASHSPRRALQMAEQQLQNGGEFSAPLIPLLEEVERGDAQSGAQLFHELVQHVRQADLSGQEQNLSFAASLLASQFRRQSENGGTPDDALRSLAEAVVTAASNPQFGSPLNALSDAWSALNSIVPAKAVALQQKVAATAPQVSHQQKFWQEFNDAESSGDDDKILRLIEQAPADDRTTVAERAIWRFANSGDLERTRQIAANLNPWQADNAIQQALHRAATAACEKGNFAAARQFAAQVTDEDDRATLLSQLALQVNVAGKPRIAEEMLGEATSLLANHPPGSSVFVAQLAVAQAYLHVNAPQAIPLLERSAGQLVQVLAAAAQLDGFLPDQHSFEGSELVLKRGFLYQSLIQPYAVATADLATIDLATARTLADRLPLPEARLMAELFVARGVLDEKEQVQTAKSQAPISRDLVWSDTVILH
jgi:hypothetical protein